MARFAWELRQLRVRAGTPSYRDLATRVHYAPSTLADAARGHRLPTREVAVALATACGGDRGEWVRRWHAASARARAGASAGKADRTDRTDPASRVNRTGRTGRTGAQSPPAPPGDACGCGGPAVVSARHRRRTRSLAGAAVVLAALAAVAATLGRRRKTRVRAELSLGPHTVRGSLSLCPRGDLNPHAR
ncbi:helix-turn-helix transcriptional regulator [Streptomyces sp. ALI-76-A]|nr:helix-turn-helix transcriptional regulator [Streptomyces sp. ALI-76-A]MDL5204811.1 helix-turn-helix transcriptional regulator [Streptomyces sp. ALI-76-A]